MNTQNCRSCLQDKLKGWLGKRHTNGVSKIFVDDRGRNWNGKMCPDCKNKNPYKGRKRKQEPVLLGPASVADPLTGRKCRGCEKRLPRSRYFFHPECESKVHSSEGQGFYGAEDWGYGSFRGVGETTQFKISEMPIVGAQ